MKKVALLLCMLLPCCAPPRKPQPPTNIDSRVKAKAELYKHMHTGWAHSKCDSLGFTSLCKMAQGCTDVDIYQAQGEPGRWYRSPEKDCYDLGQSASDISKDMFAMLLPYLYHIGDQQSLQQIYDYGKAHGFVMGRGPLSRTFMTPNMVALLQDMIGMPSDDETEVKLQKAGYAKHLDVIAMISKAMLNGGLSSSQLKRVKSYLDANPRNALFQAVYHKYSGDGDQTEAIKILLDESLFPTFRLPTSEDRCEEYLWQRDFNDSDWKPCDRKQTHDGVDFLFAAWVAGQL